MSVRRRGNGFEAARVESGRRVRRLWPSHAEAVAWERSGGRTGLAVLPSLKDLLARTLALHWKGTKSEASARANAEDVLAILGADTEVSCVNGGSIQGLITELRLRGNSAATINRKLAALSKMLSVAVQAGELDHKPKMPRLKEAEGRTRFLSLEEEHQLFEKLKELGFPEVRELCIWLVETGMRVGEALKLKWTDINDSVVYVRGTKADLPRAVPLTQAAQHVLLRQGGKSSPWGHLTHTKLQRAWNSAKEAIGLGADAEVVPHILRHTCASRMVQKGVGIYTVQKWLGHRSIHQTMRYAHLSLGPLEDARRVLEDLRKKEDETE